MKRAAPERIGAALFIHAAFLNYVKSNCLPRHGTAEHGITPKGHMPDHLLHGALTDRVIRVFHQVYAELGAGHLESVYANAMAIALADEGLHSDREVKVVVYFRGRPVGVFKADALVESVVILEYKAGTHLAPDWEEQLLNHLRNTRVELGLLLFFGRRPLVRRRILTNDQKLLPSLDPTGQS